MIQLHTHTDGSLLDGLCRVSDMVSKAKESGERAVGISDHGNMIKVYEFYKECKKEDIKPIIGCEFYMAEEGSKDNYHILLIAKNNRGLENLYKLNRLAYDNFYYKPRITKAMVMTCKEGLICSTACLGSELAESSRSNDYYNCLTFFKETFSDDLFLEIQSNKIPDQRRYNLFLMEMCRIYNIKPVVSCDAHYVHKEDYDTHDTMLCMQVKKKKAEKDRFRFTSNDFYFKSNEEILSELDYLPTDFVSSSIANTYLIADLCNVTIENNRNLLPKMPDIVDEKRTLARLCNEGLKKRIEEGAFKGLDINKVIERTRYELRVICDKGYAGYFLIVEDFMNYCRINNIPTGVGRGSIGGSEVAFILGISEIEPIRYGLLFERFLNPTRNSMPDVDSDVDYEHRHMVIKYLKDKYGEDNVAHIVAEGTLTCKAVVRKVLGAYDYDQKVINAICKLIPDVLGITLDEALAKAPELEARINRDALNDMIKLEGAMSHISMHAAGVVIAPDTIYKYVPCMINREENVMVSQWHKKHIEDIGLVKFDLLALKLLTIFRKTCNYVGNITVSDLFKIDFEDKKIYDILNSGMLAGIFQFSEPSGRRTIEKAKPRDFNSIMACESICRPGVEEADMYICNANNPNWTKPSYWDKVKHILDETFGAIVYQEQTLLLLHEVGGFTLGEADALRKVKDLEPYRERFVGHAISCRGFNQSEANHLFDRFSLKYSFNKSHACAYGKNSAICAYLLAYHPKEFMAASMTLELTKAEPDVNSFINQCRALGIELIPPDINTSSGEFVPTEEGILFPMNCLKGVGDSAVKEIMKNRPYKSFDNFIKTVPKKTVKKNIVLRLVKAGCFDKFHANRNDLIGNYYVFRQEKTEPLYFWCDEIRLRYDLESFGFYLGKHPLDGYANQDITEYEDGYNISLNGIIEEIKETTDKNGKKMCFVKVNNKKCRFTVIVFAYAYEKVKKHLYEKAKINVVGTKEGSNIKAKEVKNI